MDFPQYRKRFDNKSFYKIINERTLEEVQLVGKKKFVHNLKADKYFEIILISDMLTLNGELYKNSTKAEYEEVFGEAMN